MNILGLSGGVTQGNQDGAAALLVDGELVFAQEEERFTGHKHAVGSLPENATWAALDYACLDIRDIDFLTFHSSYEGYEDKLRKYFRHIFGHCPPLRLVDHHHAHAASAFYASGFQSAMVFTADFSGDGTSTTLSYGSDGKLSLLRSFRKPQSLGIFYSLITQVLGFRRDSDEYKVMGMSAYGDSLVDLSWLLRVEDGGYVLNEDYLVALRAGSTNPSKQEPLYSDSLIDRIGIARHKNDIFDKQHFDLARSAQQSLNEAAISLIRWLSKETASTNLCIAGGVGLNCVMNQTLLSMDEVDNMFVQPAASDAGTAVGSAYVVAVEEGETICPFPGAYLGNEFSYESIEARIGNAGVHYREVSDPAELAAQAIAEGKIVGWFQGRHEFGPRALGARSILGDPRRADMKDLINVKVKFREEFRPFAPSILEEDANKYFADYSGPAPYMTITFDANEASRKDIQAVVHVDGTSRLQTVNRDQNALYFDLISHFRKLTGVPAVLNTSYNVRGQTIVNTPDQAISTLFGSGMDMAFLGPFLITKNTGEDF